MISTPVALLVLLSALMHAGWNFIVKASADRFLDFTGLVLAGGLLSAFILPWLPTPAPVSWPWLAATTFIPVGYYLMPMQAYRHADLSIAYPLMRGSAPVMVAVVAPLAGDTVSPGLMLGISLVAAGIALPVGIGIRHGGVSPSGLGYGFATAGVITLYTMLDGVGARLSGHAIAYTMWLFFLNACLVARLGCLASRARRISSSATALAVIPARFGSDDGFLRHRALGHDHYVDPCRCGFA